MFYYLTTAQTLYESSAYHWSTKTPGGYSGYKPQVRAMSWRPFSWCRYHWLARWTWWADAIVTSQLCCVTQWVIHAKLGANTRTYHLRQLVSVIGKYWATVSNSSSDVHSLKIRDIRVSYSLPSSNSEAPQSWGFPSRRLAPTSPSSMWQAYLEASPDWFCGIWWWWSWASYDHQGHA